MEIASVRYGIDPRTKPPKPWAAALLTLAALGLGQLYAGVWRRAFAVWAGYVALVALLVHGGPMATPGGLAASLLLLLGYVVWAMRDAARLAGRPVGRKPRNFNHWWVYLGLGTVATLVIGEVVLALPTYPLLRVSTVSMEPVLRVGERFVLERSTAADPLPRLGELVVYRAAEGAVLVKIGRVIALPGSTVEIRDKRVQVDGIEIEDPWAVHLDRHLFAAGALHLGETQRHRDNLPPLVVPPGTLFVLGDNRDLSYDSRFTGPVRRADLVGRPRYVLWSEDPERLGVTLR